MGRRSWGLESAENGRRPNFDESRVKQTLINGSTMSTSTPFTQLDSDMDTVWPIRTRYGRIRLRTFPRQALLFSFWPKRPMLESLLELEWQGFSSNAEGLHVPGLLACFFLWFGLYSFYFAQSGMDF